MTPSRPKRKWLVAVIGPCILGLFLVPLAQRPATAAPKGEGTPGTAAAAINLRLGPNGATRVLADLSGAAQEEDKEKPKSMEEKAAPPPAVAAAKKKEEAPPDTFAFVKDWPFWVIVGGVVIAAAGGYMLLHNSNQKAPCAPQFNAGCFE